MTETRLELGPIGNNVMANVRRLRLAQGATVQKLTDRIKANGGGLERVAIAKIEMGKRRVTVDDLAELAKALGVTPTDLMAAAPDCRTCKGDPPTGFQCRVCGTDGALPEWAAEGTTP